MTRDQKIEAMARAYCRHNGWDPDATVPFWKLKIGCKVGDENAFEQHDGGPLWKRHVSCVEPLLDAIEPKEMAAWTRRSRRASTSRRKGKTMAGSVNDGAQASEAR